MILIYSDLRRVVLLVLTLLCVVGCSRKSDNSLGSATVDLNKALADMTNVSLFSKRPIGESCMLSSYDRSGGNHDWSQLNNIRKDGLAVIADITGAGVVHRFWMTGIRRSQELYFFFDGENIPRIHMNAYDFFGVKDPFRPPVCDHKSGGFYSYMPIPFAKSLQIAISLPPGAKPWNFFQINYERFDNAVKVESFPKKLSSKNINAIASVQDYWLNTRPRMLKAKESFTNINSRVVSSQASFEWLNANSPGILNGFYFKIKPMVKISNIQRSKMLRALVLKMYWDDNKMPSVNVPLGDFFANALYSRRFSSMAIANLNEAYICTFPMPFKKAARSVLVNNNNFPVNIDVGYGTEMLHQKSDSEYYFHASWHQAISPGVPFKMAHIEGKGHYVGCYLLDIGIDGTWNILEGDESMRLDGEVSPSFHGTGLEDYFNGGWYYSGLFDLPLHGLVEKAPIRTSQYRLLLNDRISFSTSLDFDIEFGDRNSARGYMSSTVYWYQNKPVDSGSVIPVVHQRYPPVDPLERSSIMAELFELERLAKYDEARDRCLEYVEKFHGTPESNMIYLRSLAYKEKIDGYSSVSNEYSLIAKEHPVTEVAREAKSLQWLHESSDNILLGLHINAQYKLYVNQQLIAQGDSPAMLSVVPLVLSPGKYQIALEATPVRPVPWVSMTLITQSESIPVSAEKDWMYTFNRPPDWPATKNAGIGWNIVKEPRGILPMQNYWQFTPNAFIDTSSQTHFNHGLELNPPYWSRRTAWFKKVITIPPAQ